MRTILTRLPVLVLLAFPTGPFAAHAWAQATVHAGIEVGGRGVKVTVVEALDTPGGWLYKRLFADTYNTSLSELHDGAFKKDEADKAVGGIANFYKVVQAKFKVAPERIHIVGSSGLPKASNWNDFVAAVKTKTGKDMRFINEQTEVELSILGIVPRLHRDDAILLDIGGGNTKGGFFILMGTRLTFFSVPFGTVTFTDRVRQEAMASKKSTFEEMAERLREDLLVKKMRTDTKKMPGLEKRKKAYLSGGIVWAMITLTRPQDIDKPYVDFKAADIAAFRKMVLAAKGKVAPPDLSGITDPARRKRAERDLAAVRKTYGPEYLIAGAELLTALSVSFDLEDRSLVFPRHGQVGWLSAYVVGEGLPRRKR